MTSQEKDINLTTNSPSTAQEIALKNEALNNKVLGNETFDISNIDIAAATDTSSLPQPIQPPLKQASYKAHTTDFIVNEILPLEFTGEGEHLWLHIQKSGMNTAYLAKLLSEWAEIPLRDVGYSGLKDRHALTTQWFSLRIPKKQLPESEFAPTDIGDNESVTILTQHWHNKKLNRGTHRANEFIITLRDIEFDRLDNETYEQVPSVMQRVEQYLKTMSENGVPNYFGTQRFGRNGNNVREALALFARPPREVRPQPKKSKRKHVPREQNTMELSAARSLIFNEILAARVSDGSWNNGLAGEVFNLDGSGSIFTSETIDDTLRARLASGDIHPTGVLWGTGNDKVSGAAAAIEQDIVQGNPLLMPLAKGLETRDIKAQRRALRLPIEALSWRWDDEQTLVLNFTLTTGSFATSVLASLVQQLTS
ncbi:tRNA pseudouridine(13) synthase TruD [Psychrobacter aquaticus]|uniref:tRNA pseudouridine synthase D n=1 Tax=Psychrobacter aquaticus CMS 56 TaxID=1354303 RepID=U4T5U9_9GAMM|nr:tRNA pseudouridine(13) synthase TruD [Psychrobacter aquaticus]ERL56757.1 tRNA pseudouridine 13 synthase [Psychrobacter aquaticus CMS 56]